MKDTWVEGAMRWGSLSVGCTVAYWADAIGNSRSVWVAGVLVGVLVVLHVKKYFRVRNTKIRAMVTDIARPPEPGDPSDTVITIPEERELVRRAFEVTRTTAGKKPPPAPQPEGMDAWKAHRVEEQERARDSFESLESDGSVLH